MRDAGVREHHAARGSGQQRERGQQRASVGQRSGLANQNEAVVARRSSTTASATGAPSDRQPATSQSARVMRRGR